jgi:hypothetical protein
MINERKTYIFIWQIFQKNDICPPPIQNKHNLYSQVQKRTKLMLMPVTSNEQKYKRFKLTSLGGFY